MIAHIAYAEGAPCPTLVLDGRLLPVSEPELRDALTAARSWLIARGGADVMKIAIISPARHPLFDLDYRFVQCLPGGPDRFDFRGSCGHSILAAILIASQLGWIARFAPESRVRVNVANNGEDVVCEVDEALRTGVSFTSHFVHKPATRLGDLLLDGNVRTRLVVDDRTLSVSLVSVGNPYVFVDAAEIGVEGADLFADDPVLLERLVRIRIAAARYLGWPDNGAFPKVAALGRSSPGHVQVRAVSVPSWHPSIALTGAICLGVSAAINNTVAHDLARQAEAGAAALQIHSPGGVTSVITEVTGSSLDDKLHWASVTGKCVRLLRSVVLEPLQHLVKESSPCPTLLTV